MSYQLKWSFTLTCVLNDKHLFNCILKGSELVKYFLVNRFIEWILLHDFLKLTELMQKAAYMMLFNLRLL